MSVKNSSMDINRHKFYSRYKEIVDTFTYANSMGIFEITMAYLLKNTLIPQLELYRRVHELLKMNILDVHSYSECPYCMNYNETGTNIKIKCSTCKNIYTNEQVVEKFKLIKDIKNEY